MLQKGDSSKPLYRKISDDLSREIAEGRYSAGERFPSESALVRRFGASRITVAHAIRELQERGLVDRVAGSGTYLRNQDEAAARRDLLFGLVIPNLGESEIFDPICQAIASAPEAEGHGLLWPNSGSRAREEQALYLCEQCIARGVSGVFFAPLELSSRSLEVNRQVLRRFREVRMPVVLLDRRPEAGGPRDGFDLVGIDNFRAGYVATEHLVRLGARRIAFVACQNQAVTVQARIDGYRAALAHAGVVAGSETVCYLADGPRPQLPGSVREYEAFVCANDRIAGQLMHSLLQGGLRVPEDVRLVGIDDVHYASLLPVPLTTVRQPCRAIGETALGVMLDRLQRPKMPARDVLLDCELVVRQSCGAGVAEA